MSSPLRALSPNKNSILNSRTSSPLKSKPCTTGKKQGQNMRKLPNLGVGLTPKNRSLVGFQIYEDEPEDYHLYHKSRDEGISLYDDKENNLKPKITALPQRLNFRKPLANLSISKYKGYLAPAAHVSGQPIRLTSLYQPRTYDNEGNTTHKFNDLPSFVTPPRNALHKILHKSETSADFEADELELRLYAKSQSSVMHKRSLSVGVNKGRKHLIQKSQFVIFTS